MKRVTTFAAFAVFVFLAGSSAAIAEQGNDTGPVRLNAPLEGQTAVPVIKPFQENRIRKQIQSAPGSENVGAGEDEPQQRSKTLPPLTDLEHWPTSVIPKVVRRYV